MWTSISSASGSTVTVADEVWMRPCDSVTGTRWTRCGPPSYLKRPHAASPLHEEGHLVEAAHVRRVGAEHLDLEPVALGEADVHLEEVLGEEVGLLAALGPADLDDDVLALVRVLRQEQHLELAPRAGRWPPRPCPPRPACTSRSSPSASGSISLAAARSSRAWRYAPVGDDDRLELLLAPGQVPQRAAGRPKTAGSDSWASTDSYSCSRPARRSSMLPSGYRRQASPARPARRRPRPGRGGRRPGPG